MKIKKHFQRKKIAIIDIEKINLKYEIINNMLNLFDFNKIILIIDSLHKNDEIFTELEKQKIEYIKIPMDKDNVFVYVIIKITKDKMNIINNISLESDLFFIALNPNHELEFQDLDIINLQFEKLIDDGLFDFVIDMWNTEQQIRIEFNSLKYNYNYLVNELCRILSIN